jgi:DNA-binding MarR family transcriptional regulator
MVFREIIRQLVLMGRPITHRLDEVVGNRGLTPSRWMVIDFVERSGTCTLVEISRHLSIKTPSVTRTIDFLEGRKLVEEISGKDRREKRIRLTVLGKKHMQDAATPLIG